ncbi:TetR family transcriptional regulator [Microtetraspora sp. NBRC 13810]|uniref:TetR/AcrR family transcriptional regulator n=1 Tax=Microtetraspora sp. NBRC 13810 TaxID=3030990 RepID=UPI0024A1442A|nr:TetR/AcrR family transcriptional regulator [Microtetraspora sp. NBRC 13810]GLW11445.1 TetR family transcriptional regulator [Microtetraspora sp. NBRC 13810]
MVEKEAGVVQPAPGGERARPAVAGDAPPVAGRRERKKQATRAALREAALRLSVRHGVENVTVEQIADEADIALRTFFNYFSSKEEAIVASLSAGAQELIAQFRARPRTETVLRAFREAVLIAMNQSDAVSRDHIRALELIRAAPTLVPQQLAVLAAQEKALAEAIADHIEDPAAGRSEESVYPLLCAAAVLTALRVVVDQWLQQTAGSDRPLDTALLGRRIDAVITELAAGLDRPGGAAT